MKCCERILACFCRVSESPWIYKLDRILTEVVVPVMAALVMLGVLVAVSALAPFAGADRTDARSIKARPEGGWFPAA